MQEVCGLFFPEMDAQLGPQVSVGPTFAGKGTFQFRKFAVALPYIRDFSHAVDIGAHVGTWSWPLSRMFSKVSAFEPLRAHWDCFHKNVPSTEDCEVVLHHCALGDREGRSKMVFNAKASSLSRVSASKGTEPVEVRCLDSFQFSDVEFIKIDTEGFEAAVVRGGADTINRCHPVMIVEQKPNNAEQHGFTQHEAIQLLAEWGAQVVMGIGGDVIMRWKK
jgi:FkbM family methyltransferase